MSKVSDKISNHKTIEELIVMYRNEYTRTTGRELFCCSYKAGWFRVGDNTRVRRADFEKMIATLLTRPTVQDRMESVNGVQTLIKANQHVVTSIMVPYRQVIEDRDTPWNCSVASEAYWSN